ncbi:hypothetical protein D3C86_1114060 [compost metagenome]
MAGPPCLHSGGVTEVEAQLCTLDLVFRDAAHFAPHRHARLSDGLELADAPGAGPGVDALPSLELARIHDVLEAVDGVGVLADASIATILRADVLGHVLGYIASGAAARHGDELAPVAHSAWFVARIAEPVAADDLFRQLGLLGRGEPQQRVPVRASVVVRLCHAKAIGRNSLACHLGASLGPHAAQPLLCIARGVAFVLVVARRLGPARLSARQHGMEPARAGEREEQPVMPVGVGEFLAATNARHQLAAADISIAWRERGQLGQAVDLAGFVAHLHALQQIGVALVLVDAPAACFVACIAAVLVVHHAQLDGRMLYGARYLFAQRTAPPLLIDGARNQALGRRCNWLFHTDALAVVEHDVEPVLLAHRQRMAVEHVVERIGAAPRPRAHLAVSHRPVQDVLVLVLEGPHGVDAPEVPADPVRAHGLHRGLERHDHVERRHPLRWQFLAQARIHPPRDLGDMLVVRQAGSKPHPEDWIGGGRARSDETHGGPTASKR